MEARAARVPGVAIGAVTGLYQQSEAEPWHTLEPSSSGHGYREGLSG